MSRNRLIIGAIVVVVALAALTFPLWRPLLVDDVVEEAFPGLSPAMQPTFAALPEEAQAAYATMAATMTMSSDSMVSMVEAMIGPDAPAPEAEATMPVEAAPSALGRGSFVQIDVIHGAEGSATIYELADGARVLRFDDFRVTNGPELHVLLSTAEAPRSHDELGAEYVDLGRLKGNVGSQNYDIPAELDLSQFRSVVIYCLPFQVVFSTATLSG